MCRALGLSTQRQVQEFLRAHGPKVHFALFERWEESLLALKHRLPGLTFDDLVVLQHEARQCRRTRAGQYGACRHSHQSDYLPRDLHITNDLDLMLYAYANATLNAHIARVGRSVWAEELAQLQHLHEDLRTTCRANPALPRCILRQMSDVSDGLFLGYEQLIWRHKAVDPTPAFPEGQRHIYGQEVRHHRSLNLTLDTIPDTVLENLVGSVHWWHSLRAQAEANRSAFAQLVEEARRRGDVRAPADIVAESLSPVRGLHAYAEGGELYLRQETDASDPSSRSWNCATVVRQREVQCWVPDMHWNSTLVIGLLSRPHNRVLRDAVRHTWRRLADPNEARVFFLVSGYLEGNGTLEGDGTLERQVWDEAWAERDMVLMDIVESYTTALTVKQQVWFGLVEAFGDPERMLYAGKSDDDTFINPRALLQMLHNRMPHPRTSKAWLGLVNHGGSPFRSEGHPWHIDREMFPLDLFLPFFEGLGYVLTQATVREVRLDHVQRGHHRMLPPEDAAMGMSMQLYCPEARYVEVGRGYIHKRADLYPIEGVGGIHNFVFVHKINRTQHLKLMELVLNKFTPTHTGNTTLRTTPRNTTRHTRKHTQTLPQRSALRLPHKTRLVAKLIEAPRRANDMPGGKRNMVVISSPTKRVKRI